MSFSNFRESSEGVEEVENQPGQMEQLEVLSSDRGHEREEWQRYDQISPCVALTFLVLGIVVLILCTFYSKMMMEHEAQD